MARSLPRSRVGPQRIQIPQPYRGLNRNWAFSDQPPDTTQDEKNMRSIDGLTGRTRLTQRSALARYVSTQISGANPVRDVRTVVYDNPRIAYAEIIAAPAVISTTRINVPSLPLDGDTMVIGSRTYTFLNSVNVADDILIAGVATVQALWIGHAIRGTTGVGFHPDTTPNADLLWDDDWITGDTFTNLRSRATGANGNGKVLTITDVGSADFESPTGGAPFTDGFTAGGSNGTQFGTVWSAVTKNIGSAFAPVTDRHGNVYVLGDNSTVFKYNADGKFLFSLALPVTASEQPVERMVIDSEDNIYAAARREQGAEGSKVWRIVPSKEDRLEIFWELETEGSVVDIEFRDGVLAVLEDFNEDLVSTLGVYSFLSSKSPLRSWEKAVPHPVNSVSIGTQGAFYTVSEPSVNRGATPESADFGGTTVDWVPHELTQSESRLYCWLDPEHIGEDVSHGQRVDVLAERRVLDTTDGEGPHEPIVDKTNRDAFFDFTLGNHIRQPTYRVFGFGSKPGLFFNGTEAGGGNMLRHKGNLTYVPKDTTAGSLPNQRCLIPGYEGAIFTTFMVWRFQDSDEYPSVAFYQRGPGVRYGIAVNSDSDDAYTPTSNNLFGTGTPTSGNFVPLCHPISGATHAAMPSGGGTQTVATDQVGQARFDMDWAGAAHPSRAVLIVIHHAGKGETDKSYVRVNGRMLSRFTFDGDLASGDSEIRSIFGTSFKVNPESPQIWRGSSVGNILGGDITGANHYGPMSGHMAECITVLGSTSVPPDDAHDTPLTGPEDADDSDLPPDPAGVAALAGYQWSAGQDADVADASEVEAMEGYLAHKWGLQGLLDTGNTPPTQDPGTSTLWNNHPYAINAPPMVASGGGPSTSASRAALASEDPVLAKFSSSFGTLQWALSGSGMGYGVVVDSVNDVFTVGPRVDTGVGSTATPSGADEDDVQARKIKDFGLTYSALAADGAWVLSDADPMSDQVYRYPKLRVDEGDNFYWPISNSLFENHIRKVRGSDKPVDTLAGSSGGDTIWEHSLEDAVQVFGIAFAPDQPIWAKEGDQDEDTITGPEFLYVTTGNGGDRAVPTLLKLRKVSATRESGAPRVHVHVGVANGTIATFSAPSTVTVPTGGSSALDASSQFISSVVHLGEVFYTDGTGYKVYRPRPTDDNAVGEVVDFTADTAGAIPLRCKLLESWRGRLVMARGDDESDWFMSAVGDAYDWDENRQVVTATQAISGSNANGTVGRNPDIINALIAIDDDRLIFGGDKTIHQLTGDPMTNGEIDVRSREIGMAFGAPWTLDPEGNLYFVGSRGGLYVLPPYGNIVEITERSIQRILDDLDLGTFKVHLVWNDRENGLHVLQIPYGAPSGAVVPGYFWDKKNNAWHPDEWPVAQQPTSAVLIDGDLPGDRKVLFGCEDGFVRIWDETGASDDGSRIDSYVLYGPITKPGTVREFLFTDLEVVLADDRAGAHAEFFVSDTPDKLGRIVDSLQLNPGFNRVPLRASGSYFWIRLRNATIGESWAIESMGVWATAGGIRRT